MMMHLFLTGVALKVILLIVNLSSLSEGRGFRCNAGEIVDQDLESIRQLACNSLKTGDAKSSVDVNSQGNQKVGFEWKLPKPLTIEQFDGGMITQLQLTDNCEITSITVSSKGNESQVCPREMAIHKRQDTILECNDVQFYSHGLTRSAAKYCNNKRVKLDDVLAFPADYTPKIFSTVDEYMAEVDDFNKVHERDLYTLSYMVFDKKCSIIGAIVYKDYTFRACSFNVVID
ncbi:BgTH12-04339 [Blumeria graminis f. sp. triticale]|uniref:BgTH12-04339 n=1 Tax=Blumeria graminis f. sp. triticale TaxID=1689686 RepID=A0A9W4CTZ8_BLUGR|nr:BgTH12-04339 [Blumeria graminis f. sp. triticale]